jgi:hypothetical protein
MISIRGATPDLNKKFQKDPLAFQIRKQLIERGFENELLLETGRMFEAKFKRQRNIEKNKDWRLLRYIVMVTVFNRWHKHRVINIAQRFGLRVVWKGWRELRELQVQPKAMVNKAKTRNTDWGERLCLYSLSFEKLLRFLTMGLEKRLLFVNGIYYRQEQVNLQGLVRFHSSFYKHKIDSIDIITKVKERLTTFSNLTVNRISLEYIRAFFYEYIALLCMAGCRLNRE